MALSMRIQLTSSTSSSGVRGSSLITSARQYSTDFFPFANV